MTIAIFILCLSIMISAVKGYDPTYTVNAVAGLTPNIDGTLTTGEWDDASVVSFNNTVVYVKQDGENLYVAFNVSDSTASLSYDGLAIAVDVLNDGGASPQADDIIFYIIRNGTLLEAQNADPPSSPTGGWNGSTSSTSNYWQAEFNITYAKLQITSGEPKILGVAFMSLDSTRGYPYLWPPMSPSDSGPSHWGNLISEESWASEFTSIVILPLFMIAILVTALFYKRKHTF